MSRDPTSPVEPARPIWSSPEGSNLDCWKASGLRTSHHYIWKSCCTVLENDHGRYSLRADCKPDHYFSGKLWFFPNQMVHLLSFTTVYCQRRRPWPHIAVFSRNTWLSITTIFFRVVYGGIRPFPDTAKVICFNVTGQWPLHIHRSFDLLDGSFCPKRL